MGIGNRETGRFVAAACAAFALASPAAAQAAPEPREGWVTDALVAQHDVAGDIGWTNSPWLGTHNSYNSVEQTGVALSSNDSNQQITNVAQLDAGIRSLEIDVHRSPDGPGSSSFIRVCHGRGADQAHFGCTTEKLLGPTLAEVATWLDRPKNSEQVLLLYLEDHMGDAAGYDAAAAIVTAELGDRLFAPAGPACTEVPAGLSRDDIRAADAQVLIVSDCGPGTGWAQVAFNWDSHVESRPVNYQAYPACGPDYDRETYDTRVVRYYEDSTALTNQVGPPTGIATADDGIDAATALQMTRCGVDLIGLDQVTGPGDPRLEASVWSWRVNRPRPGPAGQRSHCVIQRRAVAAPAAVGGKRSAWLDQRCQRKRRPACVGENGWSVLGKARDRRRAKRGCERRGLALGTPRTGHESELLNEAMDAADAGQVWLGLRESRSGEWKSVDPR